MNWATKRKLQYFGIFVIFFAVFVALPFYFFIYQKPTCFDGLKNGSELGVDCGGSCRLLCSNEIAEPVSRWDPRIFRILPGVYSVIAYLENPNITAEVLRAPYTFKLFDSNGLLVTERKGETFIPKGQTFAVFEGNFSTGERIPTRATFSFGDNLLWEKNLTTKPQLDVTNKALSRETTNPRVDATITNQSLTPVSNIELVAIVFDGAGNAIGASRTLVLNIEAGESLPLVFTWPMAFDTKSEACSAPVDVALVIDRSGSMQAFGKNPPQPLTDVKEAASFFVNQLNQNDQGALVSFGTTASDPIDSFLTTDFEALKLAISAITVHATGTQQTNIMDGIQKAKQELISVRHKEDSGKVMVVLTDGVATEPTMKEDLKFPETSALAVVGESKANNISIFTIGLGKDLNIEFLKQVASSSDEFYLAPTTNDLTNIYKQIATKICKKRPASIEVVPRIYPRELTPTL